LCFHRNRLLVG